MKQLSGLYAITDGRLSAEGTLIEAVSQAIGGGARIIQYRDKSNNQTRRLEEAKQLRQLCHQHGTTLIINDDIALAAEVGADGVHLGRDDDNIEAARQQLPQGIIGVSCYNDWQRAQTATQAGADYIAFGAFFPSTTKPNASRAEPSLLQRVKRELNITIVAIGGITAENGAPLITAGADMLAVVQGVFGQPDIRQAARQYAQLFN
ncbi:MAG TPA: thiamine phosphate synthase [Candidatus Tenderia sp.]|nr:thiamine phosphate synthase [Candidatus Tenderia sp.]